MPTYIEKVCDYCKCVFHNTLKIHNIAVKRSYKNQFCSVQCIGKYNTLKGTSKVICTNCNIEFTKRNGNIKRSSNHFCSSSCAATYNNKNKTYGYRRSKLEVYIEEQIKIEFPDLEFIANGKEAIGSELDFFFPDLNLAIEINGIFHYKPIFGEKKFLQIQANDKLKESACSKAKIKLLIFDNLERFTAKYAESTWTDMKVALTNIPYYP